MCYVFDDAMFDSVLSGDNTVPVDDIAEVSYTKIKNIDYCSNCHTYSLIQDNEITVCEACGYSYGNIFEQGNDSKYSNMNDTRGGNSSCSNTIINKFLPKSSMKTSIGGYGSEPFRRLHIFHNSNYHERSIRKQYTTLDDLNQSNFHFISARTIDKTKTFYHLLIKNGARAHKSTLACCLYNVLKSENDLHDIRDISKMFNISRNKLESACKIVNLLIHSKQIDCFNITRPINAYDYIVKFCAKLNIKMEYKILICYITEQSINIGIVYENTPSSIAVGNIYFVAVKEELCINRSMISRVCDNISDVTITKVYNKLEENSNYLIPSGPQELIQYVEDNPIIIEMLKS
jgi:transcription initiation factor TFIIIB Brf1 subunit/transcription initiation factor TFIIB